MSTEPAFAGADGSGPSAPSTSHAAAPANDWLKPFRKTWESVTRLLASHRGSSAFFCLLPALYLSGVLIYISAQLANDLCIAVSLAIPGDFSRRPRPTVDEVRASAYGVAILSLVQSMISYIGAVAGVEITAAMLGLVAIWQKWPGVLSFVAWTVTVFEHFFIVLFISLLLSWSSMFASFFQNTLNASFGSATLSIVTGILLPAILVWQLSASVLTRQRMIFSGE